MNCKKIKEIVATDYIDGQLDIAVRQEIEKHLTQCKGCREFALELEEESKFLLEGLEQFVPPESVWHNIEDFVTSKRESFDLRSIPARVFEFLGGFRKPAFALASSLVILIVALSILRQPQGGQEVTAYFEDGAEFIFYLSDESENGFGSESGGFGTAIEEYFL